MGTGTKSRKTRLMESLFWPYPVIKKRGRPKKEVKEVTV